MSSIRNPLCKVRSDLFVEYLKSSTNKSYEAIYEDVGAVYELLKDELPHGPPSDHTVYSYLKRRRSVPFDPPKEKGISWLMACELAFPGCSKYFFHPIMGLFGGPLRSSERVEERYSRFSPHIIERMSLGSEFLRELGKDMACVNERLDSKSRRCRNVQHNIDKLTWIHSQMFQVDDQVRDVFFVKKPLGWGRRSSDIENETERLQQIASFDALAGAMALLMESYQTASSSRLMVAKECVLSLVNVIDDYKYLHKIKIFIKEELEKVLYAMCGPVPDLSALYERMIKNKNLEELVWRCRPCVYDYYEIKLYGYPISWPIQEQYLYKYYLNAKLRK